MRWKDFKLKHLVHINKCLTHEGDLKDIFNWAYQEGYQEGKKDTEEALGVVTGEDAKRFYENTGL